MKDRIQSNEYSASDNRINILHLCDFVGSVSRTAIGVIYSCMAAGNSGLPFGFISVPDCHEGCNEAGAGNGSDHCGGEGCCSYGCPQGASQPTNQNVSNWAVFHGSSFRSVMPHSNIGFLKI